MEILDIVDSKDRVIGQAPRDKAHRDGLLHREVHIWLYTPDGDLIWQVRSRTKDTFPGLLDATIGGHVSAGKSYLESGLIEAREETGLIIDPADLHLIANVRVKVKDRGTGLTNNNFRQIYAAEFKGRLSDLKIEKGEITGFELWPMAKMPRLSGAEKKRFIPNLLNAENQAIYLKIAGLIGSG